MVLVALPVYFLIITPPPSSVSATSKSASVWAKSEPPPQKRRRQRRYCDEAAEESEPVPLRPGLFEGLLILFHKTVLCRFMSSAGIASHTGRESNPPRDYRCHVWKVENRKWMTTGAIAPL
jgi:hypothetical protein